MHNAQVLQKFPVSWLLHLNKTEMTFSKRRKDVSYNITVQNE